MKYKNLASFFGSWFHQDFDLSGNSVEEIVAAYKKTASKDDIKNLQRDISDFLNEFPNNASEKLEETFDLEVDPMGFAPSGELFLQAINIALTDNRR